ncbi:MAG: aminoacetone oxidase family FAD-binding enzyme [Bacilli bacterium]|nr:aminoacetone oxidase family FAD-binding enzyme [Bacilli bacterium]
MKIGIIGGGASGLIAAIFAKSKDNEVIILERNSECGKKILATGNGRCNYWNTNQDLSHYESNKNELIKELINEKTEKEVLDFFNSIGIVPKIRNGYYYPISNQAISIRNTLVDECINKNIKIKNNYLVEKIELKNNKFIINNELEFDKIIISTGSFASPKTGSDGMGYNFLKEFGHTIIKPLPSLVQLNTKKYSFLKDWKGVRSDVEVTLLEDNKEIKKQVGEIQLTEYGISGICIFNLSNEIGRGLDNNKLEEVLINFLPEINEDRLIGLLSTNRNIKRVLDSILNNKLVDIILNINNIKSIDKYNDLSNDKKISLLNTIYKFKVEVESTKSFNEAQTSSGGISIEEINLHTMESKLINNLYVTGELLDITGECGGYNLGIAWRSGLIAGKSARGDLHA